MLVRRCAFRLVASLSALLPINLVPVNLIAAEKPELTLLFPAGGQAGTKVDVAATGKFPTWPIQIWSDSEDIQWSCQAESGKLSAAIAAHIQPGLHWVRMYDAAGATDVRPFLVGSSPQQNEIEPNNSIDQALAIDTLPTTVFGVLNKSADVDLVQVTVKAGEWIVATVDSAKWLTSPADASLQILDSRGFVVIENLDHVGLDPYLQYQAPTSGKYFVRVFGFPATPDSTIAFSGGSNWVYRLRLDNQPQPLDSPLDIANRSLLAQEPLVVTASKHTAIDRAFDLSLPAHVAGTVAHPRESNYLRFTARAGTTYRLRLLARHFGSPLDGSLAVLDASGKELTRTDDVAQDRDPLLSWKAPADGQFLVSISDFHQQGGDGFRYRLWVEEQQPDFSVGLASDLISAKVGQETELVVTIARELGYAAAIDVNLAGLPKGSSCAKVVSQHGGDSEKKVTLKFTASEPFQGPITIVAQSVDEPSRERSAKVPANKPIWLSVVP
jgi:hypothetical protein